jgi:hypothetical protein
MPLFVCLFLGLNISKESKNLSPNLSEEYEEKGGNPI